MRLLPYDSFQIETTMTIEKAADRIDSRTSKQRLEWFFDKSSSEFRGKCKHNEFKVSRASARSNGYGPLATGKFISVENHTIIEVEMGMPPFASLIVLLWIISGVFLVFISVNSGPGLLFGTTILILGITIPLFGFWHEARKLKQRLILLFEGKEVRSQK